MNDLPITRGEFNAANHSLRERMDALGQTVAAGFARQEAFQDQSNHNALLEAEERGRTKQRLEQLESRERSRDHRIDRLLVGVVLALMVGVFGVILKKFGG